LKLELRDWTR